MKVIAFIRIDNMVDINWEMQQKLEQIATRYHLG
jgi:hypothetical protein